MTESRAVPINPILMDGLRFSYAQAQTLGILLAVLAGLLLVSILTFCVVMLMFVGTSGPQGASNAACLGCLGGCFLTSISILTLSLSQVMTVAIAIVSLVFWLIRDRQCHRLPLFGLIGCVILGIVALITTIAVLDADGDGQASGLVLNWFIFSLALMYLFVAPMSFWLAGWRKSIQPDTARSPFPWITSGLTTIATALVFFGSVSMRLIEEDQMELNGNAAGFVLILGGLFFVAAQVCLSSDYFRFARTIR